MLPESNVGREEELQKELLSAQTESFRTLAEVIHGSPQPSISKASSEATSVALASRPVGYPPREFVETPVPPQSIVLDPVIGDDALQQGRVEQISFQANSAPPGIGPAYSQASSAQMPPGIGLPLMQTPQSLDGRHSPPLPPWQGPPGPAPPQTPQNLDGRHSPPLTSRQGPPVRVFSGSPTSLPSSAKVPAGPPNIPTQNGPKNGAVAWGPRRGTPPSSSPMLTSPRQPSIAGNVSMIAPHPMLSKPGSNSREALLFQGAMPVHPAVPPNPLMSPPQPGRGPA